MVAALSLAGAAGSGGHALAAGKCSFAKRPPVVLKDVAGLCKFDPDKQTFAGTPAEQARCLLNPVEPIGRLGPALNRLPDVLETRVGTTIDLPAREAISAYLRERGASDDDRGVVRAGVARA